MKNKPVEKKEFPWYCRECGSRMCPQTLKASKVQVLVCYFDCEWVRLASRFDKDTGKKNYAELRSCPHWKPHFWLYWWKESKHDRLVVYENESHGSFKIDK